MTRQTQNSLAGKRIGVFGKGGSGKSTLTVLLARALVAAGHRVCVVDADSSNFGLAHALGAAQEPRSLLDYYGGTVFSGGVVTCPVDDPVPLENSTPELSDLPEAYVGRTSDRILVFNAGKIGSLGAGAGCDGPMTKIARDFNVRLPMASPVTLVDCKAGLEDAARGLIASMDWAIVVVDPTQSSIQIAGDLKDTFDQMGEGALPATRHIEDQGLIDVANSLYRESRMQGVLGVISRPPDWETETMLVRRLQLRGIECIGVLRRDEAIAMAWLHGTPLSAPDQERELATMVRRLHTLAQTETTEPAVSTTFPA